VTAGLALALTAAVLQAPRDTLVYNVALVPSGPHLTVEARLTNHGGGAVTLAAPPGAARAGTRISTVAVTDDRGIVIPTRSIGLTHQIEPRAPGALRFRYRVDFRDRVAEGSTAAGFDSTRLYAVTAALFVAPDPVALRKATAGYPALRLHVLAPPGWQVVTGFAREGATLVPENGDELLGTTLAAAPDFRVYRDSAGGAPVTIAIRGRRYFTDSLLGAVVIASLRKGAQALGRVPASRVTYTSDLGRKGRTSGSLQGYGSIGLIWEPSELLERSRAHDTFHETLHLWFGGAMKTERWWTEGVTDYFAARMYADWHGDPGELAALCYESYYNYLAIGHHARITMGQETRGGIGGDNTELLVYRKGMLAGLLLDAAIRRATRGRSALDDVARRLLDAATTRRSGVIRETEIRDAVREIGGSEAGRVWDRVVDGAQPLALAEITAALRDVTGRVFAVPERPKRRKVLESFVGEGR
jgi:predicted metalloprotease with PDZ domain